jgi:hypothetical protein
MDDYPDDGRVWVFLAGLLAVIVTAAVVAKVTIWG